MSFELDPRGAGGLEQRARDEGIPFGAGLEPSLFEGAGTAAAKGLARGVLGKPAVLLGNAALPVLRPTAQAVDASLGTALDR